MKKATNIFFLIVGIIIISLFVIRSWTKSHSPFLTSKITINELNVEVSYCSPQMKNRKIFGELIPFDTVWRTGANEATTISFSKFAIMGGRKVKEGKYSLWTIPGLKYWTIILNNETGQWGTNYDENKDYLRFKIEAEKLETPQESLNLNLSKEEKGTFLNISWENTILKIPING